MALEAPGVTPQGWSNGTDARIAKPINANWPSDHNVLHRMGHLQTTFNPGCTASLFGRRLVLTAGHCVIKPDGTVPSSTGLYAPRRNGGTFPWGQEPNNGHYKDAAYIANNCHITYTTATRETCGKYDWAILRLNTNPWQTAGTPGWMGYYVPGSSGWFARVDGYPVCGLAASPVACANWRVFGQDVGHSIVNFRGIVDGEPTIFNTANDISGGHSGGPILSPTYPDSNGPYILAVVTNEMCGTCNEPGLTVEEKTYPTMVRRITPALAGFMTEKRTQWP